MLEETHASVAGTVLIFAHHVKRGGASAVRAQ
jgi:hypothetical protein